MASFPKKIQEKLHSYGQDHVLAWWERLTAREQNGLVNQIEKLDLAQLQQLYAHRDQSFVMPSPKQLAPVPVIGLDADSAEARQYGEGVLRRGEVAVLLVAGGQGSRLGFEHPKGMYPVGPVSHKSLFQIHAEKVLALARRYGRPIPFLVMTSPTNHEETQAFFAKHKQFGLPAEEIHFFSQGTMPALDLETGKLLMEKPHQLFTSPNGHGGSLRALADTGLLEDLRQRGISQVFYFQVDNPLVKVADPVFLGHHGLARAEVSTKIVRKNSPQDKLGNLVLADGRLTMIEYSDMPADLASKTNEHGKLRFWVGSPAIHVFAVDFLGRMTQGQTHMPFHLAHKKVPNLASDGTILEPKQENALKFEMFIFDVLPHAQRWTVVETSRREEFEPLKNATGADSPTTVAQAISNLAGDWLSKAGIEVPRQAAGDVGVPLEISPLFALDAEELAGKVDRKFTIKGPTYFEPSKDL